jgi:LmbE family N-acetylglucosaminyl deacetylase
MPASSNLAVSVRLLLRCILGFSLAMALISSPREVALGQGTPRTLVAILAHADDEIPAGPILARYAREGARVFLIIATDGGQGTGGGGSGVRRDSVAPDELARTRAEEARCSAQALGAQPPILLGFPDGKLGEITDRTLLIRLTARLAEELERLRPEAVMTWGPDGGTGHPDHRIVGGVATQLVRAGAPGAPERLYYMYFPAEAFRAMNPQRGAPPLLVPQAKYLTTRVSFTPPDLDAAQRAMSCHRSQFTPEVLQRVLPAQAKVWNGTIALVPASATAGGTDLFR